MIEALIKVFKLLWGWQDYLILHGIIQFLESFSQAQIYIFEYWLWFLIFLTFIWGLFIHQFFKKNRTAKKTISYDEFLDNYGVIYGVYAVIAMFFIFGVTVWWLGIEFLWWLLARVVNNNGWYANLLLLLYGYNIDSIWYQYSMMALNIIFFIVFIFTLAMWSKQRAYGDEYYKYIKSWVLALIAMILLVYSPTIDRVVSNTCKAITWYQLKDYIKIDKDKKDL